MKTKLVLLTLGFIANIFAGSLNSYSKFSIYSTSSCNKTDCIVDLTINSDNVHKITRVPEILNPNIMVLSTSCGDYNCLVMLKLAKSDTALKISMPDYNASQVLTYNYAVPKMFS